MSYTVKDLVPERIAPMTVRRTASLDDALSLMLLHDYSQLPVVEDGGLIGMLTSESALQALKTLGVRTSQLHVSDAMAEAVTVNADDDVFDLLRLLRDSAAIVVVDDEDRVLTIVTPYDTTDFFRRRSEDWMFIEDIEKGLRDAVERAWSVREDGPLPEGLATAGSLLLKRVVRAVFVVVGKVLSEQSAKVALVEDDGAIKQFATDASDPALCDAVLPGASVGRPRRAQAECIHR